MQPQENPLIAVRSKDGDGPADLCLWFSYVTDVRPKLGKKQAAELLARLNKVGVAINGEARLVIVPQIEIVNLALYAVKLHSAAADVVEKWSDNTLQYAVQHLDETTGEAPTLLGAA